MARSSEVVPSDTQTAKAAHMARLEGMSWAEAAEYAGYESSRTAQVEALNGDIKAVDACVRIINTRAKLLGLETLHEVEHVTHKTLIVQGERGDYVQTLRQIAGEVDDEEE